VRARRLDPERSGDHLDRLYRTARALTGSPHDADDLVQETYARVLSRPRLLRGADDVNYLLGALRNTFYGQSRARGRRPRSVGLAEVGEPPEQRAVLEPHAALESREVVRAIARLPRDFRDVLSAVDVAGLSYRETAEALHIPAGTVMSRLYRARGLVARTLEG
jgi:RNA polymerase sigma-70 factor (ECF subfamily)